MRVRWGVIGAGGIARRRTIPEVLRFAEKSEIIALMDVDREALSATAAAFGIPRAYLTVEELLREDIDAVYIASPVAFHYTQAKQALEAGKHVLCEKPLALRVEEAEELLELAEKKRLKFGVAFMMRYNVYHERIKECIDEGKLGQPVFARAQLTCFYPPASGAWRQTKATGGGGALTDMGCHCVDLLEWFFGETREVFGFLDTITHTYEVEDTSTVLLKFRNGAQGFVDNFFNVPDEAARNVLEVYGTKGAIIAQHTIGQDPGGEVWYLFLEEEKGYDALQKRVSSSWQKLELEPKSLYAREVDAMSAWILGGEKPKIGAEVGLRNMRVLAAIYRSAAERRAVAV
ncbi:Gfo/Idh/MocA family protein [Candidatus Caldatribacterium sp. SIUC1]|uniref:Gfo/Idh/MocA family protein n=1 Tax=Candidatus Caldatribacterium sp. SIUC1 TaxID=3418365 RepID=UPI003F68E296